jgi:hypothetical protein
LSELPEHLTLTDKHKVALSNEANERMQLPEPIGPGMTPCQTMQTLCRYLPIARLLLGAVCLSLAGCSSGDRIRTEVIHGSVTIGGRTPETGRVRFVPIERTRGPVSTGRIVDGQYRIDARGGVPVGTHRVEVNARVTTGRKVPGFSPGGEPIEVDETVNLAPDEYAGPNSPFTVEVVAGSDGRIDIKIPGP